MDNSLPRSDEFSGEELPDVAIHSPHIEQSARGDWKQHLISLRQTAKATLDRLLDYLHSWRPSTGDAAAPTELNQYLAAVLESMSARQDTLEAMLHGLGADGDPGDRSGMPPAWAVELQAIIANRLSGFEATLQELKQAPALVTPPKEPLPQTSDDTIVFSSAEFPSVPLPDRVSGTGTGWLEIMLGPALFGDPKLEQAVTRLGQNALSEDADSLALLGQLLVFRFSSPDRKPTILKDLGEAYYRCFPKTLDISNPFEEALATWLKKKCAEAGLTNSIELVHPGERFDATRHSPTERGGVEIAAVFGWVVVRDGGRVFSKASVQTR